MHKQAGKENSLSHTQTHNCSLSHLVRCLALEAAHIQRSDEGHILKAVLHTHRFGSFVLKITPEFHHLSPPLYIPFISLKTAPEMRRFGGKDGDTLQPYEVSESWQTLMEKIVVEQEIKY